MGMPGFDQVLAAVADAWQNRRAAGRSSRPSELTEHLQRSRRAGASRRGELSRELLRQRRSDAGAVVRPARTAASAARRSFRTRWTCGCCCARGGARRDDGVLAHGDAHARQDGRRRHLRSARRRLPSLLGRRALARAALREDALRQRAAWPAATSRRCRPPASADYARVARETLDYVLRDMTDPAGGFYSTAGRRQRRARKASSTSGRPRRSRRCSAPRRPRRSATCTT